MEEKKGKRVEAEVAVLLFLKENKARSLYLDSRLFSVSGISSDSAGKICMLRVIESILPLFAIAFTTS